MCMCKGGARVDWKKTCTHLATSATSAPDGAGCSEDGVLCEVVPEGSVGARRPELNARSAPAMRLASACLSTRLGTSSACSSICFCADAIVIWRELCTASSTVVAPMLRGG